MSVRLKNTIFYIVLHFQIEHRSSPVKSAIANYLAIFQHERCGLHEYIEAMSSRRLYSKKNAHLSWLMKHSFSIDSRSSIYSSSQFCLSLSFPFVRQFVYKHGEDAQSLYDVITMYLNHPLTDTTAMLGVLKLLSCLLQQAPFATEQQRSQLFCALEAKALYTPAPQSHAAFLAMGAMEAEWRFPGFNRLRKFISHYLRKERCQEHPTGVKYTRSTVHVLVDSLDENASVFGSMVEMTEELLELFSPRQVQVALLAATIQLSIPGMRLAIEAVNALSDEAVDRLFRRMEAIADECQRMPRHRCSDHREREIKALAHAINHSHIPYPKSSVPVAAWPCPPLSFDLRKVECDNCDPDIDIVSNAREHRYPRRSSASTLLSIFSSYAAIAREDLLSKSSVSVVVIGSLSTMHNVLSSYASILSANAQLVAAIPPIRFCYLPTDGSDLSTWLASRDVWYGRQVLHLSSTLLSFYPSPIPSSEAREMHEQEIHRQLNQQAKQSSRASKRSKGLVISGPMAPHSSTSGVRNSRLSVVASRSATIDHGTAPPDLAPDRRQSIMLDADAGSVDAKDQAGLPLHHRLRSMGSSTPAGLLRQCIEHLVMDAGHTSPVVVFECECFLPDERESAYTIPFFQSVEIGVQVMEKASSNDIMSTASTSKRPAPCARFQYRNCNPIGQTRQGDQIACFFDRVRILNCPSRSSDMVSVLSSPTSDWLEMCIEADPESRKKRAAGEVLHVNSVDVISLLDAGTFEEEGSAQEGGELDVCIDGQLYGPFSKICISKCRINSQWVRLPLACFSEFDPS
eukprot:TRINITY_DN13604_c0_g1_i1.p1 TRINITY_DN13604_c0_g1~~TRINITY_DN13604_c0_g1_i1.p1  ORF type:complete len:799 (+),score=196.82 TRINITY_DN13604_c0_g1_i1:230-2626(+)